MFLSAEVKGFFSRTFNLLDSLFSLPTSTATRSPVSLCSFTSWILGFSPGAVALLMTVRAFTWVTERTVAAVSHGRPKRGQKAPRMTMSRRSRWNPEPLTSRRSFLLTINLMEEGRWCSGVFLPGETLTGTADALTVHTR